LELSELNYKMYSWWYRSSFGVDDSGVHSYAVNVARENKQIPNLLADVQSAANWPQQRIHDVFYVLFGRPDGCILVSEDGQRVYLVQGIAQSLHEPIQARSRLPIMIRTTLLPFEGYLVYDGLMTVQPAEITPTRVRKLWKAYWSAVENGTLIAGSGPNCHTGPLKSNGKKNKKKKNKKNKKKASAAGAKGDDDEDDGDDDEDDDDVQPAKPPVDPRVLPKKDYSKLVARLAAAPHFAKLDPNGLWVFRRFDYTLASNPDFAYGILSGGGMPMHMGQYSSLVPTCDDIMKALEDVIFRRRGNNKVPSTVSIDAIEVIEPMRELLKLAGIDVLYYAPPSKEEEAMLHPQRPMGTRVCALCHMTSEDAGVPALLKCGRCKSAFYCSQAHQKEHWKYHKLECGQK
jgi:hypothetical protein